MMEHACAECSASAQVLELIRASLLVRFLLRDPAGFSNELPHLAWFGGRPCGRRGPHAPCAEGRKTGGGYPPDEERAQDSHRRRGRQRRHRRLERVQTLGK